MFVATGTGQLNGTPATIELSFTDGGTDTGLPDTATLLIKDENGQVALTVSAPLTSGDQMMQ
jgi:hypothetical protein